MYDENFRTQFSCLVAESARLADEAKDAFEGQRAARVFAPAEMPEEMIEDALYLGAWGSCPKCGERGGGSCCLGSYGR